MAKLFPETGQSTDVAVSPPNLRGVFIPGMDQPTFADGFGLVTPLGGGGSLRKYQEYGPSAEVDSDNTQLRNINQALGAFGSSNSVYNFEGLVGLPGVPGRDGLPGISLLFGIGSGGGGGAVSATSGLLALPYNIDSINDLGTAADKLIYTSSYTTTVVFRWVNTPIAAVSSWNDSDINTEADFFIVAANAGIYISTDNGNNWSVNNPDADIYIQANCAAFGGKAVVLGETERTDGIIWTTVDYGVNWISKIVDV